MTKRVLFISNTAIFSKFNIPIIRYLKERDFTVDYASPGECPVLFCDNTYSINIARSPFHLKNILGLKELKTLICANNYTIIHCHTPTGAFLSRLAARKEGVKIIYTAHGFHFYKKAPFFYWMFFYPVEKYLAKYTDCLITINNEDYSFACKNLRIPFIRHIDGVGIDLRRFHPADEAEKCSLRKKYNYSREQFIILYTAELIPRKNHIYLIKRIGMLKKEIPNLKVIIAGTGYLQDRLFFQIKKRHLQDVVDFAGYRDDIEYFYRLSDIHVSVSKQEGLSVNNMEAMASGIPLVVSKIRGHIDTVRPGRNGFLFDLSRPDEMVKYIVHLYQNPSLCAEIARHGREDAARFSDVRIVEQIAECYTLLLP